MVYFSWFWLEVKNPVSVPSAIIACWCFRVTYSLVPQFLYYSLLLKQCIIYVCAAFSIHIPIYLHNGESGNIIIQFELQKCNLYFRNTIMEANEVYHPIIGKIFKIVWGKNYLEFKTLSPYENNGKWSFMLTFI